MEIKNLAAKMTTSEIMQQLEAFGNEQTKKTFLTHGAREPFFGVKVADLKTIVKKVKKNHQLALELYDTGNSDAMYLAGLIAEPEKMTKNDLQKWAEGAYWYMISEYTVAWVASESLYAKEIALEWIESDKENIASSGWATLSSWVAVKEDEELDIPILSQLLERVENDVHAERNRVKYVMNGFVIAVGGYVKDLNKKALEIGGRIGKVEVNMGSTSCKVPLAAPYIQKMMGRGTLGRKRKAARC